MSTSVTFNGTSYTVPAIADASWGTNVGTYLIAIASGCLQKTGGSFTLSTADVDFGATYGLKAVYFKSKTANIAAAGVVQLAKTDVISWRNNANGADLPLGITSGDVLTFNSVPLLYLALGSAYTVLQMNSGATAYTWATPTGTGAPALQTSPSFTTPTLGVATATSINKMAITAPASGSTLAVADGKTATISNTLTFTGTDSSSVAFGTGGTVAYTGGTLAQFAATTSAQLAGVISDETGSGALVFATSPTFVTPVLGVATATSINKMTITAPATSSTLAVADGKTATISNTLTFAGTDGNTMTFPSGSSTVMTLASTDAVTGTKTFAQTTFKLQDDSTHAITLSTTNSTTSHTLKLPAAQGAASSVLTNDGSGNLTWGTALTTALNQFNTFVGDSTNAAQAVNTNLLGDVKSQYRTQTATMTIAAPGVVTSNSHGMANGDKFYFTTSGALPTGVSASTTYYAANIAANTFNISTTLGNALAGTYVTTSGSQSGTHTLFMGGATLTKGAVPGITSATSPATGYVGEYLTATVSSGSTVSSPITAVNGATLSLSPGNWLVHGKFYAETITGTMTVTNMIVSVSSNSGSHNTGSINRRSFSQGTGDQEMIAGPLYITQSTTANAYLVCTLTWTGGGTSRIGGSGLTFLYAIRMP